MQHDFRQTQTFQNLTNAFAGESQARTRYTFFAGEASKAGYKHVERIFLETAENEKEHAKVFYRLLVSRAGEGIIHVNADYPLVEKDTLTNLRAAAAGEKEEWSVLYSRFGDIAEQEGFSDAAQAFRKIAEVEKRHEARFNTLVSEIADGTVFKKEEKTLWKCLNCGYVHEGPEAPQSCPACQHPQGYFEVLAENYQLS
ncbi:MAG: rubrerythrin [Desulfitobacteriaceae bacterium]